MDYVMYNDEGFLDYEGDFGPREEAITFTHYQAMALANAMGWDYEAWDYEDHEEEATLRLIDESEDEDKAMMDELETFRLLAGYDDFDGFDD